MTEINKMATGQISIHALLAESDTYPSQCRTLARDFYPRSPCGERPALKTIKALFDTISIHALLAESDFCPVNVAQIFYNFYPRSPCGERRIAWVVDCWPCNFYPRSPCGERHNAGPLPTVCMDFYPRSPCGERLLTEINKMATGQISIHALLAESDVLTAGPLCPPKNFYPRSPCGERLCWTGMQSGTLHFYPRSPCGERLANIYETVNRNRISIHALLAESDSKSAQNSGALLRIWNKFYGDFIFMLTGKAVFYPFCPCFFHIFWCEGTGNFMIAFPSH